MIWSGFSKNIDVVSISYVYTPNVSICYILSVHSIDSGAYSTGGTTCQSLLFSDSFRAARYGSTRFEIERLHATMDSYLGMVMPLRFERRTYALEGRCSIQLSYGTVLNDH